MVIKWIIIGIFVLIALYYLKAEHHAQKIKIIVIILLGAVIYFSIMGVFTSDQADVTSPRGVVNTVYVYFGWIGQTASNLWDVGVDTTHMVGNAIKTDDDKDDRDRRR